MQAIRRRRLDGTDLAVSTICCGTSSFGAELRGRELEAHITAFRNAGGNFFDSAHCYAFWRRAGAGCSECALGQYIRRNGKGDLIIGTKCGHPSAPNYRQTDRWLAPSRVGADIEDSLGRLGVEAIDLLWLHCDDTRMGTGEIIEMLNREIRKGRVRHIGASNWRAERIAEANVYAAKHALQGFAASQPEWSFAHKSPPSPKWRTDASHGAAGLFLEEPEIAWHRGSRLPVVPYTSTAGGYFASGGRKARAAYDNPITRARLTRAQALAHELNVTAGQIALAWLLNQDFPVFPITGTRNADHLRENLEAARIILPRKQVAWLEAGQVRRQ